MAPSDTRKLPTLRQAGTTPSSILRAPQDGASRHTGWASRDGTREGVLRSWLNYRVKRRALPGPGYPSPGAGVLPDSPEECHGTCSRVRRPAPEGPQQVIPFSLDIVLPLPPLHFHAGCWQLWHLVQQSEKEGSLGSTSSPSCPQLSSLKNGIDSLHPKTVEKLSVFRGEGEQTEPTKETSRSPWHPRLF